MLSGDIQVGAGGTAPFLVGYDGGVKWKVLTGLDDVDLQIMAKDPKVTSVGDLKGKGSIAMPAPDSIQSVVLRKAAQQQLGDAHALDSQIVALAHPDGVQALIAGQVAGHVTAPPFQGQEAQKGAHAVGDSYALFGKHTTNSAFALTSFASCNPKVVTALVDQVAAADRMLTDAPADAAAALAGPLKSTPAALQAQITDPGITFTPAPTGFGTFASFMQQIGLIKKVPKTSDLFFPNASTAGAS
jgi:NitT/TauT family transport system substrate-binding protein